MIQEISIESSGWFIHSSMDSSASVEVGCLLWRGLGRTFSTDRERSTRRVMSGNPDEREIGRCLSKRRVIVTGLGKRVVGIAGVIAAVSPSTPRNPFERQALSAQKKFHLAGLIPLPAAAAQTVGHLDLISHGQVIHRVATIFHEFDGDEVGETSLRLLEHKQTLAKALLPEALGLFDQMDDATDGRVFHEVLAVGSLCGRASAPLSGGLWERSSIERLPHTATNAYQQGSDSPAAAFRSPPARLLATP